MAGSIRGQGPRVLGRASVVGVTEREGLGPQCRPSLLPTASPLVPQGCPSTARLPLASTGSLFVEPSSLAAQSLSQ